MGSFESFGALVAGVGMVVGMVGGEVVVVSALVTLLTVLTRVGR